MSTRVTAKQSPRKTAPATSKVIPHASTILPEAGAGDDSNGGSGGPSANGESGGVDSRRLKKRELDRRCQRMARERTKQRIAYLEELVESFRKEDASGQVANLMKQLSDVQKQRDELAKTLKTIANSIRSQEVLNSDGGKGVDDDVKDEVQSDDAPTSRGPRFSKAKSLSRPSSTVDVTDVALEGSSDEAPLVLNSDIMQDLTPSSDEEPIIDSNLASPEIPNADPVFPKPEQSCDCCPADHQPGAQPNLWRYACEALATRQRLPTAVMKFEDAYAEDIPVRAILEGWDAVEAFYGGTLPPLWQRLRSIDEFVFQGMAVKERLACLRVMHLLYCYHSEPTAERRKRLPSWYLKRPSQAIVHSYAIDFFAWPGIRERFVFYQHRYCSNTFWRLFNSCLHVLWPYEFRDCYFRNATTGQYSISPSFEKRLFDINAWTMSDEMFKMWPEFYSDFPAYNKLPMHVGVGKEVATKTAARRRITSPPLTDGRSQRIPALHTESSTSSTESVAEDDLYQTTTASEPQPFMPSSQPLIPFATSGYGRNTPMSTAPTSFPAPNAFYPVTSFEQWWTAPMQFSQQLPPTTAPPMQQHQQQQQPNLFRDLSAFQAIPSKPDQLNGLYELSF